MTATIAVGTRAPDFRAPSSNGQTLDRDSFLGKVPVVLVFPAPEHRGEILRAFDDHLVEFGRRRIQVLAVLPETARGVRDLGDRDGMSLPILADQDGSIAESFGAVPDRAFVLGADSVVAAVLDVAAGPGVVLGHLDGDDGGDLGGRGHEAGGGTAAAAGSSAEELAVHVVDEP